MKGTRCKPVRSVSPTSLRSQSGLQPATAISGPATMLPAETPIHGALRRHKLLDDPVGATPAHLLEQVERVAALDIEHIETGQVLGKIRLRPAGQIQALAQEPMTLQLSFFFGDPRFCRPRPVRGPANNAGG